jgi:hypothetical protein
MPAESSAESVDGERPSGACVLCPPPGPGSLAWSLADPRHVTCTPCYDRLRDRMSEVAERFLSLDPRPGGSAVPGQRGAPGFGSRSPANDHVIAMRDPRSSQVARVWVGGDGRVHSEAARPAVGVYSELSGLAWSVAEHAGHTGPSDRDNEFQLLRFVDRHLDYITRHVDLAVEADDTLRRLTSALRPVTGDGRRKIGECPEMVADPERLAALDSPADVESVMVRCSAALYAPRLSSASDSIDCYVCGRRWMSSEWLSLGDHLNAEVLRAVC